MKQYLTAKEAAEVLGITLPTLYSYVSRGLIRSESADETKRTRRYRWEDVQQLLARKEQRRNPARAVEGALHWGMPLLDSAITLISHGRVYYRGEDVVQLATTKQVEAVAALIWQGNDKAADNLFSEVALPLSPRLQELRTQLVGQPGSAPTLLEQFQALLPLAETEDLAAYDLRPAAVIQTGTRILQFMVALAVENSPYSGYIAQKLQQHWCPGNQQAATLINAALILCADHELNVSSFTARCVASAGATPYQAVIGGLAALQGVKHGRSTERVEAFLHEVETPGRSQAVIAGRLKRGELVDGFGHPLYPNGDVRGKLLLDLVAGAYPQTGTVLLLQEIVAAVATLLGEHPNLDFGLVAVARVLNLPPEGALSLFALGRTVGWIGHALEAYETGRIIRPRARYVGEVPVS